MKIQIQIFSVYSPAGEFKEVYGIIYGKHNRIFVSLPVKVKREAKNVHFLVDTGSPSTYICEEVYKSFKATIWNTSSPHSVLINNKATQVFLPPVNSHFTDVNVLGMDYLNTYRTKLIIDLENHYISLSFFGSLEQTDYQSYSLQYILGSVGEFILFGLVLLLIFRRMPYLFFFFSVVIVILFLLFFASIISDFMPFDFLSFYHKILGRANCFL